MNVLITGGSGYLGHGLADLLPRAGATRVCIYSRDEYKQALMRSRFQNAECYRWFIGDTRDRERLRRAMEGCDIVIHAAALKRIEVGASNPSELVKTNILGTMNVIEAAHDAGVIQVIGISTDKAWRPVSPYGQTKALMETLLLQSQATRGAHGPHFKVVRYGNVMGSTGSVVPTWRAAIAAGEKRVLVSNPGVTRFWMYREQAANLILKAIHEAKGGDLVTPTDLHAFDLAALAEAMGLETETVGLPPWEKMHEGLDDGYTSDAVPRMSVAEIREGLKLV